MRSHHNRKRSIKLTQLVSSMPYAAVEYKHRAHLTHGDYAGAEDGILLLALLRAERGDLTY
jgi:hypothetical protein